MNVKAQAREIAKVKEVLSAEILFARDEINSWPKFAVSNRKVLLPEETGKVEHSSRIEAMLHQKQPRLSEMYSPLHQEKAGSNISQEDSEENLFPPSTQARKADYLIERSTFHHVLALGENPTKGLLRVFSGHIGAVNSISLLSFNNDEYLFTASNDATCRVFDTASGKCLRVLEGHQGPVNSVHTKVLPGFYSECRESRDAPDMSNPTWDDDRLDLLSFTLDSKPKTLTIHVFSREAKGSHLLATTELPLDPETRTLPTMNQERYSLSLVDTRLGGGLCRCCAPAQPPACELLVEEEWQPARGGPAATLRLFLKRLLQPPPARGSVGIYVTVTVRDRDLPRLASGAADRTARLWDPTTGDVLRTFRGHTAEVAQVRVLKHPSRPAGALLALVGECVHRRRELPVTLAVVAGLHACIPSMHTLPCLRLGLLGLFPAKCPAESVTLVATLAAGADGDGEGAAGSLHGLQGQGTVIPVPRALERGHPLLASIFSPSLLVPGCESRAGGP